MAEQSRDILQHVEELLREGKKQEALPFLVEHIRSQPGSARAWWLLSFTVPDAKKQIECVERVLEIDPNSPRAHARLEKLRGNGHTPAQVPPFVEEAIPVVHQPPMREEQPSTPQRRVEKKKNNPIIQYAILGMMVCALLGILGFGAVMIVKSKLPAQVQPLSFTQISLPPTWTPTVTATPLSTQTPFPTITSQAPLSFSLLPSDITPSSQIAPEVGSHAPDFTLIDIDKGVQTSLSDYEGQTVLIYFWTTWCPFCEAQMPIVELIYQKYKDEGLVILAVDVGEGPQYVRDYRNNHTMSYTILDDASRVASSKYRVTAYPTYFFVDSAGVISFIKIGILDFWGFDNRVKSMLGIP